VPPLRDRPEDISILTGRFWKEATERVGSNAVLGQAATAALARHDWPGNVRELQNTLYALAVNGPQRGVIGASALPAAIVKAAVPSAGGTLETARRTFEERFVRVALARAAGHRGRAAATLGMSRQGLAKLIHRLRLEPLQTDSMMITKK
jgi:transcriptional regulator with PAS, ATPase and Fis domain